jgi:hypothetical protein
MCQPKKYNNCGIYQIKCLDCPLKYTGQTGRTFNIRYKEHIQAIRNNNSNSGYSNHIKYRTHIRHDNRYHGHHNDGKERQTFEQHGKILHL